MNPAVINRARRRTDGEFWRPAPAGGRARKKPGFPRLSGQWSPPAYGGAGVKMCVLAQFPVDLHAGTGETA
jgi:hypothetical protein